MAKARFVLRYGGKGTAPEADVARVRGLADAVVVDSSSKMLLVEAEPEPLRALIDTLQHWVMAAERAYEVPDTRKKIVPPPPG